MQNTGRICDNASQLHGLQQAAATEMRTENHGCDLTEIYRSFNQFKQNRYFLVKKIQFRYQIFEKVSFRYQVSKKIPKHQP